MLQGAGLDRYPLSPQDFQFILKGIARLLSNPLLQTYLPNSTKKIQFHQELLVLFWKLCDFNKVGGQPLWVAWAWGTPRRGRKWGGASLFSNPSFLFPPPPEIPLLCAEEQRRAGHPRPDPLLP